MTATRPRLLRPARSRATSCGRIGVSEQVAELSFSLPRAAFTERRG